MHFLLLGATGACGAQFCRIAIEEGHKITIIARDANKLPTTIRDNENISIFEGILEDKDFLERVARCDADTFVSLAGPPFGVKGSPLTDGYKIFLPILASKGIKRALILCTPSFTLEPDKFSILWKMGKLFMMLFSLSQYEEMVGVGNCVTSQPLPRTEWTVFRVGQLVDGDIRPVEATYLGSGKDNISITRASVAAWVLEEANANLHVGKVPYICNK